MANRNSGVESSIPGGQPTTLEDSLKHIAKGFGIGFLLVAVPTAIKSRKISGLRSAASLSVLLGSFRSLCCILSWIEKQKGCPPWMVLLCKKYQTAVAGAAATSLALLVDSSVKQSTFVIWMLVRAIRCVSPTIPFAPTAIMCLSASQILSTWIRVPEDITVGYRKFLNHQGGKSAQIMKGLHYSQPLLTQSCNHVHSGMSCSRHFVVFFLEGLKRAFPVYLPLAVIGFVFSRRHSLSVALMGLLRSCTFLSLYCTLAWASACIFFRFRPGVTRSRLFACTWAAGLATLVEPRPRQAELAGYCATQALDIVYGTARRHNLVKSRDWVASVALSFASAVIMYHHQQQPGFIMKNLFGLQSSKP